MGVVEVAATPAGAVGVVTQVAVVAEVTPEAVPVAALMDSREPASVPTPLAAKLAVTPWRVSQDGVWTTLRRLLLQHMQPLCIREPRMPWPCTLQRRRPLCMIGQCM